MTKKPPPSKDEDWDDALGDRAQQTVSPDVVRKLLEMNPALREQGMNTNHLVNEAARARSASAAGDKAKPASNPQNADIFSVFDEFKKAIDDDRKRTDAEIARLKQEHTKAIAATKDKVTRWIVANDPDMRSPVTQRVLKNEAEFLKAIGFSIDGYVDERMGKAKR